MATVGPERVGVGVGDRTDQTDPSDPAPLKNRLRRRCGLRLLHRQLHRAFHRAFLLPGKLEEGVAYALRDHPPHRAFLAELHLALRRVDVHVDGGGVDLQEKAADRVASLHQGRVVAFEEGVVEAAVLDGAPVDEQMLFIACGAGSAGSPDQSPQSEMAGDGFTEDRHLGIVTARGFLDLGGEVDGHPLGVAAVELAEAFAEGVETVCGGLRGQGRQLPDQASVADEGESHVGMPERGQHKVVLDVRPLRLLAAQELAPGRKVEEEGAGLDGRAMRVGGGADLGNAPALDDDRSPFAGGLVPFATGQGEPADAGDGGERLSAKAHGRDGREVLGLPDLRGRMTLQTQQGVIAAHAIAVVRHPDERPSTGTDLNRDAVGIGIEGILDELLHDRGRAFDDLASGDLVGDVVWKESDTVHVGDKVSARKRAGQAPA